MRENKLGQKWIEKDGEVIMAVESFSEARKTIKKMIALAA